MKIIDSYNAIVGSVVAVLSYLLGRTGSCLHFSSA